MKTQRRTTNNVEVVNPSAYFSEGTPIPDPKRNPQVITTNGGESVYGF